MPTSLLTTPKSSAKSTKAIKERESCSNLVEHQPLRKSRDEERKQSPGEKLLRPRLERWMGRQRKLHSYVLLLSESSFRLQFASKDTILFQNHEGKSESMNSEYYRRYSWKA